jgi:hypothetical protein
MATEPTTGNENLNKEVIQWGCNYLSSHGYTLKNNLPENVQDTPWSYVIRFATTDGYIYLKHTPKPIALEPVITQILHDQFHASVPEVVAHNEKLNCFLMKDAGISLRQILKKQFDVGLLCKGIRQFTSLQLDVADHVDVLIDIGVPDWRLDKLPDLYMQLLLQKDILIADGLSEEEISELEILFPKISHLCKKLSSYSIKQTIVQPDFHDNNLLIDDAGNITIIDLGEIVISHPFFSLINCLHQAKKHHALKDKDDAYQHLMDACFENYMRYNTKNRLLDAFAIAKILLFVYGALANVRLMDACGREKLMSFQPGRLGGELKELMSACAAMDLG